MSSLLLQTPSLTSICTAYPPTLLETLVLGYIVLIQFSAAHQVAENEMNSESVVMRMCVK